jgi:hypothetical protein
LQVLEHNLLRNNQYNDYNDQRRSIHWGNRGN